MYTQKHSEKTKQLISERLKGHKPPKTAFKKGQIPWNKGLKGWNALEKHNNWLGGKSFEPYGKEFNEQFKEMVRDRDNYTCQICKKQKPQVKRLHIHHIDYVKSNNFTYNCITLCTGCHTLTNYNRDLWKKFFEAYVSSKYGYSIIKKSKNSLVEVQNE